MTTLFNYDPYYDDFDEDKNFMRVLFRPGYSVQARELTQLQTILQNQIEKFGNHIFKSGSPIVGGRISLDDKANFLVLETQYNNEDILLSDFAEKTVVSYNSNKSVRAKVIAIDNTTQNPVLVLKYLSGDVFSEGDEIKILGQNIFAKARTSNAVGRSYVASIQEGVYYFKGQFVKIVPQFLVLELFHRIGYNSTVINANPSYKVGIQFDEVIIDEIDDTSLLDPAQGAFNYQAPGATRFKIQTELSKRTLDSADESTFFEVIRLVDGVKTKEIEYPIYSELEKTMARRTYDESGNYTVDPFVISLDEGDLANGKFDIVLDPGKAYVGGFEFQTIAPTTIEGTRARETSQVLDYDLPTNYSSSVVIDDIEGYLDISSYPKIDLHCVEHASVNTSTTIAYNSTKIGTLRASMMKYNDATNSDVGSTHSYRVNVFDVNLSAITGTLPSSGSSTTVIKLPAAFSSTVSENAYANMYFRLTDSSVNPILIQSSNTLNQTITLSQALPFVPSSNNFTIESDFKVCNSFLIRNGSTKLFKANINSDSKEPTTGFSYITEPKRSGLIFSVPFEAVKAASIADMDFFARKTYANKTSGGDGVITLTTEGTDTFAFAGTPGVLNDSVILNNITCVIRNDSASIPATGITPNTVLSLANSNFTVTAVSPTTIEINVGAPLVKADFLITTRVNNAENSSTGAIRGKQLLPLNQGVDLHSKVPFELDSTNSLDVSNSAIKTVVSDVGIVFEDIGSIFYDNETTLQQLRNPGSVVSLQVPDVYEIVKIVDSKSPTSNVTTAMLNDPFYDITANYEFDNGQRKTHYDHATIKLRRGYSSPLGKVYVMFKYLKHLSAPSPQNDGLFTVDSYLKPNSNFGYNEISKFADVEESRIISLRSCLDFRPTRQIGSDILSGAINPDPDFTTTFDFEYYLARIDQLVVKPSREFAIIEGKSAISPVAPPIGDKDMLIYTLNIPAYTESIRDIRVDFKNNRRYTMRDIGAFEKRMKQLEYYVALNSLEKDAATTKILDANGLERSKYGILVDNFTSTDSQATYKDVGFDNRCLIENSELKSASLMRTFKMRLIDSACSGAFKVVGVNNKKVMMLDYTTKELARQPYATKSMPIAAALFANFNGTMKLYPEYSADVDTDVVARVTLNSLQGIENAFGFINEAFKYISDKNKAWSEDKDSPFAKVIDSKWYESKVVDEWQTNVMLKAGWAHGGSGAGYFGNIQRTGTETWLSEGAEIQQKQISVSTSEVDTGTFITDLAIQPYMKPTLITFNAAGVRPNTSMYHFFDNTPVDQYVIVPNLVQLNVANAFASAEPCLIANTTNDLAANLASYLSGGNNFDAVIVCNVETGTNTVSIINETGKSLTNKFIIGLDSGRVARINTTVEHHSSKSRGMTSNTITLSVDAPSTDITGNTIYIIHDNDSVAGIGESHTITSYNVSTKVATVSGTFEVDTSKIYTYSFGRNRTNKLGQISGVFCPPAATFRSGERAFRVTESFNNTYDLDAISFAEHTFVSSGIKVNKTTLVDTVYNVGVGPKIVDRTTSAKLVHSDVKSIVRSSWQVDPLAQTFFVDPQVYPNGVFVSDVDLFFRAKDDDNLPVTLQIRPTENGIPSTDFWYPDSVVVKYPSEIITSESPSVTNDATKTKFTFQNPVFLKPGLHALCVLTSSPDYTMWISEKGATTARNEFVSVNPYIGTLYKSQNAMEYVPSINEDLMFIMNRCSFSSSPATFSLQSETQDRAYAIDKFRLIETTLDTLTDAPITLSHAFISKPVAGAKETTFRSISPFATYAMSNDEQYAVGSKRKEIKDQGDFTVNITMTSSDDAISPVVSLESVFLNAWENFIDNAELTQSNFNIIATGSGYSNTDTISVISDSGDGAEIYLVVDGPNGNVVGINVASSGSGYIDDFDITINSNTGSGAIVVLNSEYDSAGGPCDARYITKPVTLADGFDAGDLRVFLSANRRGNSDVAVFYKVLSSNDTTDFKDRPYQKMVCVNPSTLPSASDVDFREFEFRPSATENQITYTSDSGVTYDSFKTFAIKIVMTSNDPSITPKVKDLRIIALPAE